MSCLIFYDHDLAVLVHADNRERGAQVHTDRCSDEEEGKESAQVSSMTQTTPLTCDSSSEAHGSQPSTDS